MDNVQILKVRDKDADQQALAIVRSVDGLVALTLSLEHDGDVQAVFTPAECTQSAFLLQKAVAAAQGAVLAA